MSSLDSIGVGICCRFELSVLSAISPPNWEPLGLEAEVTVAV
jgi:hypothetical protein